MSERVLWNDRVRRLAAWLSTPGGLGTLFAAGLLIRLVLARGGGFPFDVSSFAGWAQRLGERGPWRFYPHAGEKFFVDYPPGYLYILWVLGALAKAVLNGPPPVYWLKIPPILADLGLAWLVAVGAERLAPVAARRRLPIRGIAAGAILLNPVVFFVSAVWGQADSIIALLVVGAILLLGTGSGSFRREAGGIVLLALALGTKPQVAFLLPVVALVLVWRHVRASARGAADERDASLAARMGIVRVASLFVVGAVTGLALLLPFHMGPGTALRFYAHSARTYEVTSVFAFNLWGVVGFWKADIGAKAVRLFGVPAVTVGVTLFVLGAAAVLRRAWQALVRGEDEGRVLALGSAALTIVGFAMLTRIHERYLFLPLALSALLLGVRWMRPAFAFLSVVFLVNVYFPYVYYLGYVGRPQPKLGGLFDAVYGTDITGVRMRALSAVTAALVLLIALRGWHGLERAADESEFTIPPVDTDLPAVVREPRPSTWTMRLHPVGRSGAALALIVFFVAFGTRIAGLGHPPGMYFDEVYHARAGGEYLNHKEVFEYTHPPLAKEIMGFAIQHLSGFHAAPGRAVPAGFIASSLAPRPTGAGTASGMVWATRTPDGPSHVELGLLDGSCGLQPINGTSVSVDADAVAATDSSLYVAGRDGAQGAVLVRVAGGIETWRATLPARAKRLLVVQDRAFVVTRDGQLVSVSPSGDPSTVAIGAYDASALRDKSQVWVSFPNDHRVAAWDSSGARKTTVAVSGAPMAITAVDITDRVIVSTGDRLVTIDPESQGVQVTIPGGASNLSTVPETGVGWAQSGTQLRAIEPLGGTIIGRTAFGKPPSALSADPVRHRLVGVAQDGLECAGGRPQFAWRLFSAIFGAVMVAMVFLIALRLLGSVTGAGLAALFLTVDGLAFSISRIAMNDSYATGFLLAAWFAVLSALYHWGCAVTDDTLVDPPRNRRLALWWIIGLGVLGGAGLASKWVGLYALAAIGFLILWDGAARAKDGLWGIAGGMRSSALVLVALCFFVPLAIYVLTYIPYFSLGHGVGDFLRLQRDMYEYHANLKATHPFSSPWFGWPFGYRAVFLYLSSGTNARAEIWTLPNLVVFWGGLAAMGALVARAWRKRSAALAVILGGALFQYLPWAAVSRVTFMYHYLPTVPFLCIALAWWLSVEIRDSRYGRLVMIATAVAAVLFFLGILPMLEGWTMPVRYLDDVRRALPWIIR